MAICKPPIFHYSSFGTDRDKVYNTDEKQVLTKVAETVAQQLHQATGLEEIELTFSSSGKQMTVGLQSAKRHGESSTTWVDLENEYRFMSGMIMGWAMSANKKPRSVRMGSVEIVGRGVDGIEFDDVNDMVHAANVIIKDLENKIDPIRTDQEWPLRGRPVEKMSKPAELAKISKPPLFYMPAQGGYEPFTGSEEQRLEQAAKVIADRLNVVIPPATGIQLTFTKNYGNITVGIQAIDGYSNHRDDIASEDVAPVLNGMLMGAANALNPPPTIHFEKGVPIENGHITGISVDRIDDLERIVNSMTRPRTRP